MSGGEAECASTSRISLNCIYSQRYIVIEAYLTTVAADAGTKEETILRSHGFLTKIFRMHL